MKENVIYRSNKRLLRFDLLKIYACYLVIWGHAIMHLYVSDYIANSIYRFVYSFHMSLFMMISGLFASSSMKLDVKPFIVKKAKQLLYPCIIWGLIVLLFADGSRALEIGLSHITLFGIMSDFYWYSDFWFLKSCFICYCLAYFGAKTKLKTWLWVTITLLLSQLIPVFQIPFMYPSFLMGMMLKNSKCIMDSLIKYKYILFTLFILMTCYWTKDVWIRSHGISVLLNSSGTQFVGLLLLRLFRLMIGLFGALSIGAFFSGFDESKLKSNFVRSICAYGKYSLEIYIVHSVLFVYLFCRYISFADMNFYQFNLLLAPIISLLVLGICCKIIAILYKSNFLSKLLFGKW